MIVSEAPLYHATHEDMVGPRAFERFIEKIEEQTWATGICRIRPPPGWTAHRDGYELSSPFSVDKSEASQDLGNIVIPHPVQQLVHHPSRSGGSGMYDVTLVEQKPMSVAAFKAKAEGEMAPPARMRDPGFDEESVEREYWKGIVHKAPLYGADMEGSLFDTDVEGWNVSKLDTLLSRTLKEAGASIPGVTSSYLYFGMWKSTFAWHTEDMDLHSVNYLHFGQPKTWYAIPPSHTARFNEFVKGRMPEAFRACPEFLRHKETLVSPRLLKQHGIPVIRLVQRQGDFVISFPGVYHAGFNHGFNGAESTNFATSRWPQVGRLARACYCHPDSVVIDVRAFGVEPVLPRTPAPRKGAGATTAGAEADAAAGGALPPKRAKPGRKRRRGDVKASSPPGPAQNLDPVAAAGADGPSMAHPFSIEGGAGHAGCLPPADSPHPPGDTVSPLAVDVDPAVYHTACQGDVRLLAAEVPAVSSPELAVLCHADLVEETMVATKPLPWVKHGSHPGMLTCM